MKLAFRICKARYAATAFTGEGALYCAGRWHPKGVPLVYCAETRALAILEQLVRMRRYRLPPSLVRFRVELPSGVEVKEIARARLPEGWRSPHTYAPALQRIGAAWLRAAKSVALRVPSTVVPEEHNILLNPRHPAFGDVRIRKPEPFAFDSRLA